MGECISQDEFVRGLFVPAAGDAREEFPAEEAREAEDDGGMMSLATFDTFRTCLGLRYAVLAT